MTGLQSRSGFLAIALVGATVMTALPVVAAPAERGQNVCRAPMMGQEQSHITVTGRGEAYTLPDMASISLGVTTEARSAADAMRQNSERQQVVLDTLTGSGVDERDIQTSGLSLSPVAGYSFKSGPPEITGYRAQNMVTVRLRDLDTLGETLDSLIGTGINEINGISFERDVIDEVSDKALSNAVQDARHRAEVMARAAGMTLGPVVVMRESVQSNGPQPMQMRMAAADASGSVPVARGELTVSASVEMKFALIGQPGSDCAAPEDSN